MLIAPSLAVRTEVVLNESRGHTGLHSVHTSEASIPFNPVNHSVLLADLAYFHIETARA